jgi:hypothetical protein
VRSAAPCLGVALIIAFLAASLAPCPPPVGAALAHTEPAPGCHAQPAASYLTAPCPCQCGEHAPIAGSSARIGVALPSTAPDLAPRLAATLDRFAPVRVAASFAIPIDHIPLPV